MIFTVGLLLRILTLFIFFLWWMYWRIIEREADQQIPKTRSKEFSLRQQIRRWVLRAAEGIMILQVMGLHLFQLPWPHFMLQLIGFVFVLIGTSISFSARKTLGVNWAHAYEYQVKKEQELVTRGIYSLIRHPIYTGLCLAFIGGELVAQSYLTLVGVVLLIGGYWQARQEEKILVKHFGDAYKTYMKRTKMFLPYLW